MSVTSSRGIADGGDDAAVGDDQVLVHPEVGLDAALVDEVPCVGRAVELQVLDALALDPRADVAVLRRQPVVPHVGRLDDVVVDADDLGQHLHGGLLVDALGLTKPPVYDQI